MEDRKYISSIDIVKYLCAIMIVDSHVRLINIENSFLFDFFRFALYFFHCSFGYFFAKNINKENILRKNVKRLIIPLVFWIIIYLFINLYNDVLAGSMGIREFIELQFISLFINGVGFHLWFLVALIIYVIVASLLYRYNKLSVLYPISIVLFIIGLLGTYYYPLGNKIPLINILINAKYFTTFCRLFMHGLPMFTMGIYIANNEERLVNISNSKLAILSLIALAISILEIYYVINCFNVSSNICEIGLCLITMPLFILLIKNPMNKYSGVAKPLKYISTFMYYSHPLFRTVLASLLMRLFDVQLSSIYIAIIVVALCTIVGFILYKINNKYLNKVLS